METAGGGTRRRVERGPTGERVASNVRRLRERRGLTVRALSARLDQVGRPILPSGITKLESGDRSVDVDDLMALACALECTPNALLLAPGAGRGKVSVTEDRTLSEGHAWKWARASDYPSYQAAAKHNPWTPPFDVYEWARDGVALYQLWSQENRPDAPVADPENMIRALTGHRELLEAHYRTEAELVQAGVPISVIDELIERQRSTAGEGQ